MLSFRVEGPFEVVPVHEPHGRLIEKSSIDKFWDDEEKAPLADAVGCYVFAFRTSGGLVPVYVGQSKTGFRHECFQHHKLTHYNMALARKLKSTPVMFFVVKDDGSACAFESCIDRVEHLLIQFASARNPELQNIRIADWSIHGVYRSGPGGVSKSAHLFKQCLGFTDTVVDAVHNDEPAPPVASDTAQISPAPLAKPAPAMAAGGSVVNQASDAGCDGQGL